MSKSKTNYTLKIMKILRLASQGSNFTGSYKKKSIFTQCIHYIHMECFLSPISSTPIVCILNLNTEGGTSHNKYCKWSSITTLFIPKLFTFLVLPFLFFLIVVVNFANIRFIFLGTFFSCLLPKADGSSFSSSLEKIWVVICWPGSTSPPLFFACLFGAPIPQFSFRTFNTDSLKENSFILEVSLQLGNLFNTWFLSKGRKPLAQKPDTKLVDFRRFTNLPSKLGNIVSESYHHTDILISKYPRYLSTPSLLA